MKYGIKESREALEAVNEMALFLAEILHDGFQLGEDVNAIVNKLVKDEKFKAKLQAGYDNASHIGNELADLDLREVMVLAKSQMDYIPKIIQALKGPMKMGGA